MLSIYKNLFIATTDTIVGIGAPVSEINKKAIYSLKKRDLSKKIVIMVDSLNSARKIKGWVKEAEEIAKNVWPGPITLVINDNLAIRIPNNNKLRALIKNKGPIYMTSANISGEKPLSFLKAKKVFKEIKEYYDFGKGLGKPSSIIDIRTKERLR